MKAAFLSFLLLPHTKSESLYCLSNHFSPNSTSHGILLGQCSLRDTTPSSHLSITQIKPSNENKSLQITPKTILSILESASPDSLDAFTHLRESTSSKTLSHHPISTSLDKKQLTVADIIHFKDDSSTFHATTHYFAREKNSPKVTFCSPLQCITLYIENHNTFLYSLCSPLSPTPCQCKNPFPIDYHPKNLNTIVSVCIEVSNTREKPSLPSLSLFYLSISPISSLSEYHYAPSYSSALHFPIDQSFSIDPSTEFYSPYPKEQTPKHFHYQFSAPLSLDSKEEIFLYDLTRHIGPHASHFALSHNLFSTAQLVDAHYAVRTERNLYLIKGEGEGEGKGEIEGEGEGEGEGKRRGNGVGNGAGKGGATVDGKGNGDGKGKGGETGEEKGKGGEIGEETSGEKKMQRMILSRAEEAVWGEGVKGRRVIIQSFQDFSLPREGDERALSYGKIGKKELREEEKGLHYTGMNDLLSYWERERDRERDREKRVKWAKMREESKKTEGKSLKPDKLWGSVMELAFDILLDEAIEMIRMSIEEEEEREKGEGREEGEEREKRREERVKKAIEDVGNKKFEVMEVTLKEALENGAFDDELKSAEEREALEGELTDEKRKRAKERVLKEQRESRRGALLKWKEMLMEREREMREKWMRGRSGGLLYNKGVWRRSPKMEEGGKGKEEKGLGWVVWAVGAMIVVVGVVVVVGLRKKKGGEELLDEEERENP